MKVFVRKNNVTKLGYELVIVQDDGQEVIKEITQTDPANDKIMKLPENPSNRKWLSMKKVVDNELELTYKASMTFGPRGENIPRKDLSEYLEGEDKELYLKLVEKAKKNREEANRRPQLTEKEKLQRKIEAMMKKLQELGE